MELSIIVPVYNAEKYLPQCIDSILASSINGFELLLIDDGSIDSSGAICDDYAVRDSRIHVTHKQNGGVSSARNVGLDLAKGRWITFIDADDIVSNTFLEELLSATCDNDDSIGFIHGGCSNYASGAITSIEQRYDFYVGTDLSVLIESLRGLIVSKLFKRSVLMGSSEQSPIYFDTRLEIAEDMLFTLEYVSRISCFAFVPTTGYYYRRDNTQSATAVYRKRAFASVFYSYERIFDVIETIQLTHGLIISSLPKRRRALGETISSVYRSSCESRINDALAKAIFSSIPPKRLKYLRFASNKCFLGVFVKLSTFANNSYLTYQIYKLMHFYISCRSIMLKKLRNI